MRRSTFTAWRGATVVYLHRTDNSVVSLDSVYGSTRSFGAAFLNGCPPCGRARFRLAMAEHSSSYVQRSRMTPSQGGPPQQGIPCGASARPSRSIWTKLALSCCNRLSVRHLVYDRVPSDFRRPTRSASAHRHGVALSYTLSRDTTKICDRTLS